MCIRDSSRGALNIPGYRPAGIYCAGTAQRLVNMEGFMPGREAVSYTHLMELTNPSNLPDPTEIEYMEEPIVSAEIMVTTEFVGSIMTLCQERRGNYPVSYTHLPALKYR